MGLFSIDAIKFAEYVLAVYGGDMGEPVPSGKQYPKECDRLIRECHELKGASFSERIYLLDKAGDGISPHTSYEHHLKIECYLFAGATCRPKAIEFLPTYLKRRECGANVSNADYHFEHLTNELAKCYKGEYMYKDALKTYADLYETHPGNSLYITESADCLIKMGEIDAAIRILESQRDSKYYHQKYETNLLGEQVESRFQYFIDKSLADAIKMKQRGYVYRPRKPKE